MKGSLHTDELMRPVTASATGLRTERRISHVFIMDVPTYAETLFITDAAINIFPDLDAKRDIVQNAIDLFTQIGLGKPRVAISPPVETVTTKIPSTIDSAALRRRLISQIGGDADIEVVFASDVIDLGRWPNQSSANETHGGGLNGTADAAIKSAQAEVERIEAILHDHASSPPRAAASMPA